MDHSSLFLFQIPEATGFATILVYVGHSFGRLHWILTTIQIGKISPMATIVLTAGPVRFNGGPRVTSSYSGECFGETAETLGMTSTGLTVGICSVLFV